jgi:hypothetical protein
VRQQGKRTAVTHTPWTFGSATLSVLHKELHNYRKLEFLQVEQGGKVASPCAFAEPSDGLEPSTPSSPWRRSPHEMPPARIELAHAV